MQLLQSLPNRFLYSQDLSNYKTIRHQNLSERVFLYSQDLSNYKTVDRIEPLLLKFLYSQDLSNYKTDEKAFARKQSFCILKI